MVSTLWLVRVLFVTTCLSAVSAAPTARNVRIDNIAVETHSDVVIDSLSPQLSWTLDDEVDWNGQRCRAVVQTAYRITIMSSATDAIICDSGRVTLPHSLHRRCDDAKGRLQSDSRYVYTIQYWSSTDAVSHVYTNTFRTALYHPTAEFTGSWIGGELTVMNQVRKEFYVPAATVNATIFIAGIGYYTLSMNGQTIDPSRRMDPAWTTYERRVYYASFDVINVLIRGSTNAVGVLLGLGWYNREQWAAGLGGAIIPMYGPPARLLFQLNLLQDDGSVISVVSDPTWTGRTSANSYDGVYMGVFYDSRMESPGWDTAGFVDSRFLWLNASVVPSPFTDGNGVLQLQPMDPIRIGSNNLHFATSGARTGWFQNPPDVRGAPINASVISGVNVPYNDVFALPVWDLQQTIAGWCRVNKTSLTGSSMQLRYSETLLPPVDSNQFAFSGLNFENIKYIAVTDTYVFHSDELESFEPMFTYHGFRYVGIAGAKLTTTVECFPVHSETTLIGNFTSSSSVINQIQHNTLWSMLGNAMSLPTDCTQRNERRGWLGDAGLSVDMALFNFDLGNFYQSFLQTIADNQADDGTLPDTAPFTCCTRPTDPGWGVAFSQIAITHFSHYNNSDVAIKFFDAIERWVLWLNSQHAQTGLAHFYAIEGDWEAPVQQTNASLITSFSYLRDVYNLITLSNIIGNHNKSAMYKLLYSSLAAEWHAVFYNPSIHGYADGIQSANVLSLALPAVVPPDLRANVTASLVQRIKADGYLLTEGIISVDRLFPVLSTEGQHDLAVELAQQRSYPSYGYMFSNSFHNATTLWESWSGNGNSYNHHMFGSIGAWFYRFVAGIDLIGLDEVTVWPRMTHNSTLLPRVQAEVVTLRGPIVVDFHRTTQTTVEYSISIPNGMTAKTIFDPIGPAARCRTISESGKIIWKRANGVTASNHPLPILKSVMGIRLIKENDLRVMSVDVDGGDFKWIVEWEL